MPPAMRFTPRSSGQITSAFGLGLTRRHLNIHVCQTHLLRSGKSLAPGRAAGGIAAPLQKRKPYICVAFQTPGVGEMWLGGPVTRRGVLCARIPIVLQKA